MVTVKPPLDILREAIDGIQPSITEYLEVYENHSDLHRVNEVITRNPERSHRTVHWHIEDNSDFVVQQSYKNGLEIFLYNDIETRPGDDTEILELASEEFLQIFSQWYITVHPTLNIRNELSVDYLSVNTGEDAAFQECIAIPLPNPIEW